MDEPALADLPGSTRAAVLTLSGMCGVGLVCAFVLAFALVALAQMRAGGTAVPAGAGPALYRFAAGTAAFAVCRGALAAMILRRSNTARKLAGLVEAAAIALGLLSWYGGPGFEGPRVGSLAVAADAASWFGATAGIGVSLAVVLLLWSRASEAWCSA
ncbi:hypothetical protein ACFQS3_03505 [Glycomyces mayteni]|uniref:DUF2975 domain-containing protein n=1 Tax=Glycomyces mayteni TaxID=543887 RepID=A0ABW2D1S9_9ACTN|nr:hypothetical protein GCM10025732_50320 [Glycomyces mayteni]